MVVLKVPLKVAIKSEKVKSEAGKTNYKLTCSTNVDKSVEQKISWIKDNVDLDTESNNGSSLFIQTSQSSSVYANSMLEFNWLLNRTYEFNGVYKCKIYIRYPEVGQGTYYFSEPVRVTDYSSEGIFYTTIKFIFVSNTDKYPQSLCRIQRMKEI